MATKEIDRIESAIRHIQTSTDIDQWAAEIAVEAMRKQIPQKAMKSIDAYDKNLYKLYCPTCGALVAYGNSRVGFMNPGRWKEHVFEGIMGGRPRALMCNQCNSLSLHATNFCPNCGADMRGGDSE